MYANSGYLNNSRLPFKDKSKPLIVGSCGTYRLRKKEKLPTWRPKGRIDYQLLYVASGKAHFYFNGKEQEVIAGHMVLFQPWQEQHYEYFAKDKPEVYWVHFTGGDVKNILRRHEIPLDNPVYSKKWKNFLQCTQINDPPKNIRGGNNNDRSKLF